MTRSANDSRSVRRLRVDAIKLATAVPPLAAAAAAAAAAATEAASVKNESELDTPLASEPPEAEVPLDVAVGSTTPEEDEAGTDEAGDESCV